MDSPTLRDALAPLVPLLPMLAVLAVALVVLLAPMPGRGPKLLQRRDPWRTFRHGARRAVMSRAGGRCEGPRFLVWGRCSAPATDADHIYPWSRCGPTVVSNGQALCRAHNRSKSNLRPPWWYVQRLESRRARYVPVATDRRVMARLTADEHAARTTGRAGSRR